jgi:DNA-directed RNA polymerase subunit H (RpoH/RPB5)
MSTEHYTPLAIYKNLPTFFEYRLLELIAGSHIVEKGADNKSKKTWLTDEEFMQTIQFQGYVIIEASDSKERKRKLRTIPSELRKLPVHTVIILFDDVDTYTYTPEFKKLISRLPYMKSARKYNLDIITIYRSDPSVYLKKTIAKIEKPKGEPDGSGYIKIYSRKYVALRNINPLHVNAPKCRILSDEEEKEVVSALHTEKRFLPHIYDSDGMLIWYPAEVGDVVEEMHVSESVGLEKIYRIVIATPQIEK